jgi:hypothetical protein
VTEDDPIGINTDGVCIHSGFSVAKAEREVRLFPSSLCVLVDVSFLTSHSYCDFWFRECSHVILLVQTVFLLVKLLLRDVIL